MKFILLIGLLASFACADTWVNGYMRKDGTYVPGYWRTDANDTKDDNYSTKGNVNPYTGEKGTKPGDYGCSPHWVNGYTDSEGKYHSGHMSTCD